MNTPHPHSLPSSPAAPLEFAAKYQGHVIVSTAALTLLYWKWRPLAAMAWQLRNPMRDALLSGSCTAGWFLLLVTALAVEHFNLLGLREA